MFNLAFALLLLPGIFAPHSDEIGGHNHQLLTVTVSDCYGKACGDTSAYCQVKQGRGGEITTHCVSLHDCHHYCTAGTTQFGHDGCCCSDQACVDDFKSTHNNIIATHPDVHGGHHHQPNIVSIADCYGTACGDATSYCQVKLGHGGEITTHCAHQHDCYHDCTGTTQLGHDGCCCSNQTCVDDFRSGQNNIIPTHPDVHGGHHHQPITVSIADCYGTACGDATSYCQVKLGHGGEITTHCAHQHDCYHDCTGTTQLGHDGCCCSNQTCVDNFRSGQNSLGRTVKCRTCDDVRNDVCTGDEICHNGEQCVLNFYGHKIESYCGPQHECDHHEPAHGHAAHEHTICCSNDTCFNEAIRLTTPGIIYYQCDGWGQSYNHTTGYLFYNSPDHCNITGNGPASRMAVIFDNIMKKLP